MDKKTNPNCLSGACGPGPHASGTWKFRLNPARIFERQMTVPAPASRAGPPWLVSVQVNVPIDCGPGKVDCATIGPWNEARTVPAPFGRFR